MASTPPDERPALSAPIPTPNPNEAARIIAAEFVPPYYASRDWIARGFNPAPPPP